MDSAVTSTSISVGEHNRGYLLSRLIAFTIAVSVLLVGSVLDTGAVACPIYLNFGELASTRPIPFQQLFLVARNESNNWRQLPLQVNHLDKGGNFLFGKQKHPHLQAQDRLVIEDSLFGGRMTDLKGLICNNGGAFELQQHEGAVQRYAYLLHCPNGLRFEGVAEQPDKKPVSYNKDTFQLSSRAYDYNFVKDNYMMFRNITIKNGSQAFVAAEDSNLLIYSDLKNFFSMKFDNQDISSYLNDYEFRDLGIVGNINFYLNILFFKMKLSLVTDVSFYEDAVNIPMKVFVPSDSVDYLNDGSGILYTWLPGPGTGGYDAGKVILLDRYLASKNQAKDKDSKPWLDYCRGPLCRFSVGFTVKEQRFVMQFNVARALVEKSFYPVWITDLKDFQKRMKWPQLKVSNLEKKVGLFFDTAHLASGTSEWDFWMRMSQDKIKLERSCPAQVNITKTFSML